MNLVLSLITLALGPVLYRACQKMDTVRAALEGLLFVTIAGIVIVHIMPDVFAVAGVAALGFLVSGVIFAFAVERYPGGVAGRGYTWIVLLGALGLAMHAVLDGMALIPGEHVHDDHADEDVLAGLLKNHLAIGVILHRIPVGMAIWWTVRPRLGRAVAIGSLAIIAFATSAAYLLGEPVIEMMEGANFACFQAFAAGTLLHVIVFSSVQRDSQPSNPSPRQAVLGERLGIILGISILFLLPHVH